MNRNMTVFIALAAVSPISSGADGHLAKPARTCEAMGDGRALTFKQPTANYDEEFLLLTRAGTKSVFSLGDKQMIIFWKKQSCSSDECLVY